MNNTHFHMPFLHYYLKKDRLVQMELESFWKDLILSQQNNLGFQGKRGDLNYSPASKHVGAKEGVQCGAE